MLFFESLNFTLTYRPWSRNIKPNTLSRQFAPDESEEPETILPQSRVVASLTWEIESSVRRAQAQQPDPGHEPPNPLFVPDTIRSQVLQWAHSSWCHPGAARTLEVLRRKFWWPTMDSDTQEFVGACAICARSKPPPSTQPLTVTSSAYS